MIRGVVVVIPARDEAQTLAACLDSVRVACDRAGLPSTVVVVLDGCADGSAALIGARDDVVAVTRDFGNVGRSRREGVEVALGLSAADLASTWIASTDADSVVPRDWLVEHLHAARTADVYVGSVVPRLAELDEQRRRRWQLGHPPGATLGHVHGANLGVRASAYRAVGGFRDLATAEDVDLVDRLRADGHVVAASERHAVVTSARLQGRAPGGYGEHLRGLASDGLLAPS